MRDSGNPALATRTGDNLKGQHVKTGRSLTELAQEIERQSRAKVDYVADTRRVVMTAPAEHDGQHPAAMHLELQNGNGPHTVATSELANRQIGERLAIPARYFERMQTEAPALLARNVNHWLQANPEPRLIRTLDGTARAFLSNRYQRIDNVHVAEVILPILAETPGIEIVSTEITERKLYIKAKSTAIRAEVKGSRRVGDVVEAGICVTNSEVGLGAVSVQPFYFFLACLNGMVRNKEGLRSAHIGTRLDVDEHLASILADDTRKVLDRGVLLKVRDVVRALLDQALHQEAVDRMSAQTRQVITGSPAKAIEVLSNDLTLTEGESASVLRHLIEGGDLSRFGLMNAVTRSAEDAPTYDRASDLEILGARVFDLNEGDWKRIAEAA